MSSIDVNNLAGADGLQADQDLGPLAWVLDELRKSLEGAVKAMRRFVRDAETARESDLASLDAGPLRIARQQLHQACGALEMVGMGPASLVLRGMELAVQKFVQRPDTCTDQAAATIERASFALIEYLEGVLAGKTASPVALFPQYRDVQALAGADRVHPADLWPAERRFREPEGESSAPSLTYGPEARARLDAAVLRIVKSGDVRAALNMRETCLGLVASASERESRAFWKICAGFFEAVGLGLLPADVYVKRVASRVLLQYATLAKGDPNIADRLVQDLLFFCSQAQPPEAISSASPALQAVREAFALERYQPVDYETSRFGRFDPAMLAQARKRIAAATETWSALAGGDRNKLKPAADQFMLVCDSLRKLHTGSDGLAQALTHAMEATTRSGEPPSPSLAMEVATSVLYLQAAFEQLDTADGKMEARANRLAERLNAVVAGAEPEPLEQWMEDLYRRVSDNQTMGSVVDELRSTLAEVEKALDLYFRDPGDTALLGPVPGHLAQMRGVLSVLGLDQASLAVVRMRDTVERLLINQVPEADRQGVFETLGNNLGSLGFLIDMLSYQRTLARKLFVYDEELGELRIVMGKARTRSSDALEEMPPKLDERSSTSSPDVVPRFAEEVQLAEPSGVETLPELSREPVESADQTLSTAGELASEISFAPAAAPAPIAAPSPEAIVSESPAAAVPVLRPAVEDELLDVFLEEAREVVATGLAAMDVLRGEPGDLSEQTTLRRAFHTLKGSSRMVGLNDFGDAAWSMEQLLNAWLAEQKPVHPALHSLSTEALQAFGRWADDIAAAQADGWDPKAFRASADAMRLEGANVALAVPGASAKVLSEIVPGESQPAPISDANTAPEPDIAFTARAETATTPDFQVTEISEVLAGRVNEPLAVSEPGDVQEIDLSVFEAALNDPVVGQIPSEPSPDGVDFELDLSVLEGSDVSGASHEESEVRAPVAGDESGLEQDELASSPPVGDGAADVTLELGDGPHAGAAGQEDSSAALQANETQPVLESAVVRESQDSASQTTSHDQPLDDGATHAEAEDDAVKVIDTLRIGIPLYNVYLNEADEWSRRLVTSLQEWSLELHEPLPDTAVALAHSLAGSSATVGFTALSELARLLEHALQHVQLQSGGTEEQAAVFKAAAEDVRRLLHQFAAGFLKEPSAEVMDQLQSILQSDVINTLSPPLEDAEAMLAAAQACEPEATAVQQLSPAAPQELEVPAEQEPQPLVQAGHVAPALSVVTRDQDQRVDDAIARAVAMGTDMDDDIDAIDVIDPDLFPIFEEEAQELLPELGGALRQWASRPDNTSARSEVLRALHTLKGSSRLAGAMRLGEMAHRLESAIEALDVETVTPDQIEPLQASFDGLQANFDALRAIGQGSADTVVALPLPSVEKALQQLADDAGTRSDSAPAMPAMPAMPAPAAPVKLPAPSQLGPLRAASNQSVRVRAQLLDRMVNQAGEVMISRSRLDVRLGQFRSSLNDLSGNLDRLRQQLRDIEVQAESQMQSRLALSKDSAAGFDPLEFDRFTRVQELTRMMAESVNDVATVQRNLQRAMEGAEDDLIAQGRQARELQRDLLKTRMVEFEGIAERLYAVVRQASKETGKQIKLDIIGGSIEMDRGVLDRMTPAFEHLLRNCVAHGIENPDVRTAAGKPATGTITVALHQEGNDVSVEFRDDGAGLDLPRIREKAFSQGIVGPDVTLSDADAADLIFMPGFSTAAEVTGLAGRGIGMDVVRAEINGLGGRIETSTETGKGAAFRMVLPLTTAVTQVVMLRAGKLAIGVPASVVDIVRRTPAADLEEAYKTGYYDDGTEKIPFFWSGALLQASARSGEPSGKTRPVVIFRSAAQRIAMHVDEVLGNQEVVVKNLGPQLSRLPGLAGMSVLASGAVVLIYNPVALSTVYGDQVRAAAAASSQPKTEADIAAGGEPGGVAPLAAPSQVPLVLVVDDSITVRRVTQRLLQREGYRVALAADGLQALERLQEERPTVVLSDIEMPRMDGFDLARNIRADGALRDLPIIMITSRIAEKHREHAMELGVNHYLGKPYSDEELLSLIQHYARLEQAVEA
ncbi:MAG: Hpt domain-containing protein [Acidovorax sp.]|jgi:chemosensory pili system protein ChpA (sensor histidine kinase/response regulator)